MATFLYFIPEKVMILTQELLTKYHIEYAFAESKSHTLREAFGPNGKQGIVLCDKRGFSPEEVTFNADLQDWQQVPNSDAWVGFYRDRRPTPKDLLRKDAIASLPVKLGDGNEWQVPIVRRYVTTDEEQFWMRMVPSRITWDAYGNKCYDEPARKYESLVKIAERWIGDRFTTGVIHLDTEAVDVLSYNYRIGIAEASVLNLFDSETEKAVLDATIDLENFLSVFEGQ